MDRRVGGPLGCPGHGKEKKIPMPARNQTLAIQPKALSLY